VGTASAPSGRLMGRAAGRLEIDGNGPRVTTAMRAQGLTVAPKRRYTALVARMTTQERACGRYAAFGVGSGGRGPRAVTGGGQGTPFTKPNPPIP
jgi:hypothetical protein